MIEAPFSVFQSISIDQDLSHQDFHSHNLKKEDSKDENDVQTIMHSQRKLQFECFINKILMMNGVDIGFQFKNTYFTNYLNEQG